MISMLGQVPDILLPDLLAGAAKPDASPTSSPGITADWLGGKPGHLPRIAKSRKLPVMPRGVCPNLNERALLGPRRRGDVPAQLRFARTRRVPGPGASLSGGAWSCPPQALKITKPGRPPPAGRQAEVSRPPVCVWQACRSSVQVTGRDRGEESIQRKAEGTGKQWLRISLCSSITRSKAGLPPVPRDRVREPAGQASMSVSAGPAPGSLSFCRIVGVPFEAFVAALDSWPRTGRAANSRSARISWPGRRARSHCGHLPDAGPPGPGATALAVRMRLDIDRWSSVVHRLWSWSPAGASGPPRPTSAPGISCLTR